MKNRIFYFLSVIAVFFAVPNVHATVEQLTVLSRTDVAEPMVDFTPSEQLWISHHKALRVGVGKNIPLPLIMSFQTGVVEGVSADYLKIIGSVLGLKVEISRYQNPEAMLSALQNNEIDLLAYYPQAANEASRLTLSSPYLIIKPMIVYRKGTRFDTEQLFKEKSVVYVGDEQLRDVLRKFYPAAHLINSPSNNVAFTSLVFNDNEFMLSNNATAAYFTRQGHGDILTTVPSKHIENINASFATLPQNAALIEAINSILEKIQLSSAVRIGQTWGLDYDFVVKNHPLDLTTDERTWLNEHKNVSVFVADTHAPFTFIDENGRLNGFSIALLDMIANRTGIHFDYKHYSNLSEMKAALITHPDAIIALADGSAIRNDHVAYSRTYVTTPWVLMTRKDKPEIHDLNNMAGMTVVVYQGGGYFDALKKSYPLIHFIESSNPIYTSDWLSSKRIDGIIIPYIPATYFLNNFFSDRFCIATVFPLEPVQLAIALSKSNPVLLSIINKAMIDIPPETLQSLIARWQRGKAPANLSSWSSYRTYFLRISGVAGLIVIFFLWRNTMLRRSLVQRRRYESELEQARLRADKANESKSLFLSQMSHEIRTPLNALSGLLELEHRGKSSPIQRESNIEVACAASKSLLALVSDVLDLAKIESGSYTVQHTPVSLPDTLEAVVALFRQTALDKNLPLIVTCELTDPHILFDGSMLRQIVSNLLSNAIKFTETGQVEVALYQDEHKGTVEHYVLEVCDTGSGVDATQQSAIFEPFIQADTGRPAHAGTGLGLSICRQLASMLGGTISVESKPGEGAIFMFRFSAESCEALPTKLTPTIHSQQISHQRILIVDDHAPNRMLLGQQLEFVGYQTVAVESGELAITAWETLLPDIVITDCNMPGMSGFELTRILREKELATGMLPRPIFGLTAMAEYELVERAEAAGMTGCLFKPIELDVLINKIGSATSSYSLKTEADEVQIEGILNKLTRHDPLAVKELTQSIIEQNREDIARLETFLASRDLQGMRHAAHQLLGGAKMIHATALMDACKMAEEHIEAINWHALEIDLELCKREVQIMEASLVKML